MIEMISGHLGSGEWKIKDQNGCLYLSHRLPFSPKSEFRIGCDEILDVQVERIQAPYKVVRISMSDDRICQAKVNEADFNTLITMVNQDTPAPEAEDTQQIWVKGLILFFIACFIFELLK